MIGVTPNVRRVILSRVDGEGSQAAQDEILRCAQDDVAHIAVSAPSALIAAFLKEHE